MGRAVEMMTMAHAENESLVLVRDKLVADVCSLIETARDALCNLGPLWSVEPTAPLFRDGDNTEHVLWVRNGSMLNHRYTSKLPFAEELLALMRLLCRLDKAAWRQEVEKTWTDVDLDEETEGGRDTTVLGVHTTLSRHEDLQTISEMIIENAERMTRSDEYWELHKRVEKLLGVDAPMSWIVPVRIALRLSNPKSLNSLYLTVLQLGMAQKCMKMTTSDRGRSWVYLSEICHRELAWTLRGSKFLYV